MEINSLGVVSNRDQDYSNIKTSKYVSAAARLLATPSPSPPPERPNAPQQKKVQTKSSS